MNPVARSENLVVEETEEGLVVYDLERDRIHALNATVSVIFEGCDGTKDLDGLCDLIHEDVDRMTAAVLVLMTLSKLDSVHLLSTGVPPSEITRRELLSRLRATAGVASAILPAIQVSSPHHRPQHHQ